MGEQRNFNGRIWFAGVHPWSSRPGWDALVALFASQPGACVCVCAIGKLRVALGVWASGRT